MLSQGPIGKDKPIGFASRTLSQTEENYSTIEKELLAIVWACKYFRPYLFGNKFTLYTDHQPLTYIFNMKDPSSKLVRWRLSLEEYDYSIQYRKGSQNVVADGLSRIKINSNELNASSLENASIQNNAGDTSDIDTVHSSDTDDSHFIKMTLNAINSFSHQIVLETNENEEEKVEQIFPKVVRVTIKKRLFNKNEILRILKDHLDYKKVSCIFCSDELILIIQEVYRKYFSLNKNLKILFSKKILHDVKTPEEENEIIEKIHMRAHRGIMKNYEVMKQKYFFPRMKNKMFDEVILELEKRQKQALANHNKDREIETKLHENEIVYVARQGIKCKTKPKFEAVKVAEDKTKTFIDDKNRKLHKANMKRNQKN